MNHTFEIAFTWHWPRIAMALIYITALVIAVREHGEPREGNNNFFGTALSAAIGIFILYMGGFWG